MAHDEEAKRELAGAEDARAPEESAEAIETRFPELLIVLAKRKSFILKFVGIAAVLAIVVSLVLPKSYTASTKLLPPQQNQSMALTSVLGQLGPLAGLAGQGLGVRNASDLFVAMLRSRTVADDLIDRFSLMSVYHKKLRIDARRRLEDVTEISAGKEGVITLSVEDRDPQRAADLANAYATELQKLTKTLAVTEASRRRIFFEGEMKAASEDLSVAEVALKQTQEKTGLILLDSQARAMIEALTSLRARVAMQEVQVQAMRSFATPENPDLVRAEQELIALRAQVDKLEMGHGRRSVADVAIENVPTAGLEYLRKLRDLKYHEALYELLAKQYEAARIDEGRDAVLVQQLDKAVRPEKKSWPLRAVIVVVVTILALLVAILVAFGTEALEGAKKDAQFAIRLRLFQSYLRVGHKS